MIRHLSDELLRRRVVIRDYPEDSPSRRLKQLRRSIDGQVQKLGLSWREALDAGLLKSSFKRYFREYSLLKGKSTTLAAGLASLLADDVKDGGETPLPRMEHPTSLTSDSPVSRVELPTFSLPDTLSSPLGQGKVQKKKKKKVKKARVLKDYPEITKSSGTLEEVPWSSSRYGASLSRIMPTDLTRTMVKYTADIQKLYLDYPDMIPEYEGSFLFSPPPRKAGRIQDTKGLTYCMPAAMYFHRQEFMRLTDEFQSSFGKPEVGRASLALLYHLAKAGFTGPGNWLCNSPGGHVLSGDAVYCRVPRFPPNHEFKLRALTQSLYAQVIVVAKPYITREREWVRGLTALLNIPSPGIGPIEINENNSHFFRSVLRGPDRALLSNAAILDLLLEDPRRRRFPTGTPWAVVPYTLYMALLGAKSS